MASQPRKDALTIRLPQAITVSEVTITGEGLGRVLDAAVPIYLRNQPQDQKSVTLQLAMKAAARALLAFMRLKPQPGWSEVPRLTRHDDATAVVIRYMLENFFTEAIRFSGGVIDATGVPSALADTRADARQGEYGELVTAIAGLVSGPDAPSERDGLPPDGSTAADSGATAGSDSADAARAATSAA